MLPNQLASRLRQIATEIDNSESPSLQHVAREVMAAIGEMEIGRPVPTEPLVHAEFNTQVDENGIDFGTLKLTFPDGGVLAGSYEPEGGDWEISENTCGCGEEEAQCWLYAAQDMGANGPNGSIDLPYNELEGNLKYYC